MGLSWQQGPLSPGAIGRFVVPEPLPKRLLYAELSRRRMRVQFGGTWIADSEDVLLLFEPGHYPMAYFRETDVSLGTLQRTDHTTRHPDLGLTSWYTVRAGDKSTARGAWQHTDLPSYAHELQGRVAFAWPAMDAFYEEDERIVGHAADSYHRIDIRQASRSLVVRHRDRIIADTNVLLAACHSVAGERPPTSAQWRPSTASVKNVREGLPSTVASRPEAYSSAAKNGPASRLISPS